MKMYRTAQKNRTNYVYYDANDKPLVTLRPGQNGITAADIADLHKSDDEILNNEQTQHRAGRKTVTAIISYDGADPSGVIFGDVSADPLFLILSDESYGETRQTIIDTLKQLPSAQFEAFCAVRIKKMSARAYATKIGKSEASVSKNLSKVDAKLRKALGR